MPGVAGQYFLQWLSPGHAETPRLMSGAYCWFFARCHSKSFCLVLSLSLSLAYCMLCTGPLIRTRTYCLLSLSHLPAAGQLARPIKYIDYILKHTFPRTIALYIRILFRGDVLSLSLGGLFTFKWPASFIIGRARVFRVCLAMQISRFSRNLFR